MRPLQTTVKYVSEYQYYYFEAIDKPLTEQQQKELRQISTRAQINARRLENEYHYGSFKGKPLELMKKYFDAHIYYACWATRVFMLKVPTKCVDLKLAKKYCTEHTFTIVENGADLIFCFHIWVECGDGWWDEDGATHQLISLRDDILGGDYRCLYLAWLARQYDSNDYKDDDGNSPPVPAGLRHLTEPLKTFAEFMFLEDADLDEVAKLSVDDVPKLPTLKEIKDWIADLPEKDCRKVLVDLLQEKMAAQVILRELKIRFLKERKTNPQKLQCPQKPVRKSPKK